MLKSALMYFFVLPVTSYLKQMHQPYCSSVTYWKYRVEVERTAFMTLFSLLLLSAVFPVLIETRAESLVYFALVFMLGMTEMARLERKLDAALQAEFRYCYG